MSLIEYYSVRRLSPFQGTLQVVALPQARALSTNGITWKIELLTTQNVGQRMWGSMEPVKEGKRFFTYGLWSADNSIKRVPVNAILGDQSSHPALPEIIDCLCNLPDIPFQPMDHLERWLLEDETERPLALLSSQIEGELPVEVTPYWHAMPFPGENFQSGTLAEKDKQPTGFRLSHKDILEKRVNTRAGKYHRAVWFRRNDTGGGESISGTEQFNVDAADFPPLLLDEEWTDTEDEMLVRDYLEWQSPMLLTLWGLDRERRGQLEKMACKQAVRLSHFQHLLPELVDEKKINAALIEARIRQSQ